MAILIFLSHIFLSDRSGVAETMITATALGRKFVSRLRITLPVQERRVSIVINLPLRFWEKAIPKADRSPDTLIDSLISNHVIPELTPLAASGTPLGYFIEMTT